MGGFGQLGLLPGLVWELHKWMHEDDDDDDDDDVTVSERIISLRVDMDFNYNCIRRLIWYMSSSRSTPCPLSLRHVMPYACDNQGIKY